MHACVHCATNPEGNSFSKTGMKIRISSDVTLFSPRLIIQSPLILWISGPLPFLPPLQHSFFLFFPPVHTVFPLAQQRYEPLQSALASSTSQTLVCCSVFITRREHLTLPAVLSERKYSHSPFDVFGFKWLLFPVSPRVDKFRTGLFSLSLK